MRPNGLGGLAVCPSGLPLQRPKTGRGASHCPSTPRTGRLTGSMPSIPEELLLGPRISINVYIINVCPHALYTCLYTLGRSMKCSASARACQQCFERQHCLRNTTIHTLYTILSALRQSRAERRSKSSQGFTRSPPRPDSTIPGSSELGVQDGLTDGMPTL